MEFWGVEVKPGEPLKVPCDAEKVIHISQASLGEIKDDKAAKNVVLRLRVEQGIFIIGSLSAGERPQISTDLILDRPFELSHDLKSGSVYFLGYSNVLFEDESESEDFDSEEDLPILAPANETPELKADDSKEEKKTELKVDDSKQEKKTAAPQQVSKKHALKTPEPAKEEPASEDDDDSDDDVENDDGDSEDSDDIMEGDNSSDDQEEVSDDDEEDDESDEEPKEKPKEKSKKRQSEPIVSPPKKAKAAAANKPVAKKGTPQAAQPKKSQQPMKNSNKNQKKPFPKKR